MSFNKQKILYPVLWISLFCVTVLLGARLRSFHAGEKADHQQGGNTSLLRVSVRNPVPEITTGQTPLFVAREKGLFARYGLDVTVEQGAPATSPVTTVVSGGDDFGIIGGPETLLVKRAGGAPIKAIAVLHRNANFPAFITLKSSRITQLSQLEGKKVCFYPGHVTTDVLKPLLRRNNITVQEINYNLFDYNQLIRGQVDAQWGFTVRAAIKLPLEDNVQVNVIPASDYGVVTQGYTIFALESTILKRPEICEQFLRGLFDGIEYSLSHKEEAEELMLGLNRLTLKRPFYERSEGMYDAVTSHTTEFPCGYMDRNMFESACHYLKTAGAIPESFDERDAYTTQFIEKIHHRKF